MDIFEGIGKLKDFKLILYIDKLILYIDKLTLYIDKSVPSVVQSIRKSIYILKQKLLSKLIKLGENYIVKRV